MSKQLHPCDTVYDIDIMLSAPVYIEYYDRGTDSFTVEECGEVALAVFSVADNCIRVHIRQVQVNPFLRKRVISIQYADAVARRLLPGARLVRKTEYGVIARDHALRVYMVR